MFQHSAEPVGNVDVGTPTSPSLFLPLPHSLSPSSHLTFNTHTSPGFLCFPQSETWSLLPSGTQWNSCVLWPPTFLSSPNILFFIQNTPGILSFSRPSVCQSYPPNSLCTCPSPSLEYSLPRLCLLRCPAFQPSQTTHINTPLYLLHRIRYLLKLS